MNDCGRIRPLLHQGRDKHIPCIFRNIRFKSKCSDFSYADGAEFPRLDGVIEEYLDLGFTNTKTGLKEDIF
jgi:hypothetical protein